METILKRMWQQNIKIDGVKSALIGLKLLHANLIGNIDIQKHLTPVLTNPDINTAIEV